MPSETHCKHAFLSHVFGFFASCLLLFIPAAEHCSDLPGDVVLVCSREISDAMCVCVCVCLCCGPRRI